MDWPVNVVVPVAWGDMDAFGHVNNTVYLRWFETARMDLFVRLGVLERMERDRVGPILASTRCDFRVPVSYPDEIVARAAISRIGNSSYVMAYEVHSTVHDAVAAEGEGVIVMMSYESGEKVPIDAELRTALEANLRTV